VKLTLPQDLEACFSPGQTTLYLASGPFVSDGAPLGLAARVAGLSRADFFREPGRRRIPIHHGSEEPSAGMRTVASLATMVVVEK